MGGFIYLIGGAVSATGAPFDTVMVYDPHAETWTQKAALPTPRNMISACVVDGKILTFGGTNENWETVSYRHVEAYDIATNTWARKTDMPSARWGLGTCVVNGTVYVIGGRSWDLSSTFNEAYDIQMDSWRSRQPMQHSRTGLVVAAAGNKVYAVGGHQGPPLLFLSSLEEYSPVLTAADEDLNRSPLPSQYALAQNYPNPFNPTTVIKYELPKSSEVRLSVYDMIGHEVALLVNEKKSPGSYGAQFDATRLASGVYLYRLTTGDFVLTRIMVLIK